MKSADVGSSLAKTVQKMFFMLLSKSRSDHNSKNARHVTRSSELNSNNIASVVCTIVYFIKLCAMFVVNV